METKVKKNERLPDEEVTVKLSICNKCNGIVRCAVEHMMDTKSKNEFAKEVMKYNLTVKAQPILEYRAENAKWCECKYFLLCLTWIYVHLKSYNIL